MNLNLKNGTFKYTVGGNHITSYKDITIIIPYNDVPMIRVLL